MRILTVIRALAILIALYLGYWIFIYELVVWRKSVFAALVTEPENTVVFFGAVIFLVLTQIRSEFFGSLESQIRNFLPFGEPTESDELDEIPVEWMREKTRNFPNVPRGGPGYGSRVHQEHKQTVKMKTIKLPRRKYRIPGLRRAKQIIVGLVLIFNVVMSQGTLFASQGSEPFFWYFVLMAWICLEYLWKSRKEEQLIQEIFKSD